MSSTNNLDAKNAYEKICKFSNKSGRYYKTLFHVHTPESYDYKLFIDRENFSYENATDEEMFEICVELGILPKADNYTNYKKIGVEDGLYESYKEAFAFLIFVYYLAEKNIEIAILADHNTIAGYKKVDRAIKNLKEVKGKIKGYCPTIIAGIEITCADKNHVIGIFDYNNEKVVNKISEWLEYNLVNIEAGTILTSLNVMEFLTNLDIITYIAHFDNADMIQKTDYLSGAYKKELLQSKYCNVIGCSTYEKINILDKKLTTMLKGKKFKYLIDNDSHCIEGLEENYVWVKGFERNVKMIREAIDNYDVSISLDREMKINNRQYIKGIHLQGSEASFLINEKNKKMDFTLVFSSSLNCIIGGRGTGKSTLLKFLEYALNQKCESLEMLNFICRHGHIWLLYIYNNTEYMIEMLNPLIEDYFSDSADVLAYYDSNRREYYTYKKSDFNIERIKRYSYEKNLKIYEIFHNEKGINFKAVKSKRDMLNNFFDTTYSVNELVRTASGDDINDFIYNVMFNNVTISNANSISVRSLNGLKNAIKNAKKIMNNRYQEVMEIIEKFNNRMGNTLKIVYTQNNEVDLPDFKSWINLKQKKKEFIKIDNIKYSIRYENVIDYFEMLCDRLGIFGLLDKIEKKEVIKGSILNFAESSFELDVVSIDETNEKNFILLLYDKILNEANAYKIIGYLKYYVTDCENFTIQFNVNSKTGAKGVNFKDIKILSLGQKVVAMLDFILGYSEYSEDYRPLIIDQPEDNLDNSYIYYNLVKQLRDTKEKRQIILATHNATIVTNSMSDLVCVMDSDGRNGWIKRYGYPGNKIIKKEIVNCLEGGIESFKHKQEIYKEVLK